MLGLIVRTDTIRARHHAVLASDTLRLVDEDDACLGITIGCTRGTDMHTLGILTLLTLNRKPILLDIRKRTRWSHSQHTIPVIAEIDTVLVLASDYTSITTTTTVEVYDQTVPHD
jgi:16S rRNA C1402 N4-methylase RsmH